MMMMIGIESIQAFLFFYKKKKKKKSKTEINLKNQKHCALAKCKEKKINTHQKRRSERLGEVREGGKG